MDHGAQGPVRELRRDGRRYAAGLPFLPEHAGQMAGQRDARILFHAVRGSEGAGGLAAGILRGRDARARPAAGADHDGGKALRKAAGGPAEGRGRAGRGADDRGGTAAGDGERPAEDALHPLAAGPGSEGRPEGQRPGEPRADGRSGRAAHPAGAAEGRSGRGGSAAGGAVPFPRERADLQTRDAAV